MYRITPTPSGVYAVEVSLDPQSSTLEQELEDLHVLIGEGETVILTDSISKAERLLGEPITLVS